MKSPHCLAITIGAYKHWSTLRGPRADGEALLDVLKTQYGFDSDYIRLLADEAATARGIRVALADLIGADETVRRMRTEAYGRSDLLIYYAGHGHWDSVSQSGYWIPYDGGKDPSARKNWLPHSELVGYLTSLPFRHVLVVCDACFAGHMLKRDIGLAIERQQPGFPKQAARFRSREVLTSIGGETTPDMAIQGHSAFAFHLLDALRYAEEPWLDKLSLYDRIRRAVPKAQCGDLEQAGHQQGGAFIFLRNTSSAAKLSNENGSAAGRELFYPNGNAMDPSDNASALKHAQASMIVDVVSKDFAEQKNDAHHASIFESKAPFHDHLPKPAEYPIRSIDEARSAVEAWAAYLHAKTELTDRFGIGFRLVPPVSPETLPMLYKESFDRFRRDQISKIACKQPLWVSTDSVYPDILRDIAASAATRGDQVLAMAIRDKAFLTSDANGGLRISAVEMYHLAAEMGRQSGCIYRLPTREEWIRCMLAFVRECEGGYESVWGLRAHAKKKMWTASIFADINTQKALAPSVFQGQQSTLVFMEPGVRPGEYGRASTARLAGTQIQFVCEQPSFLS